MTLISEDLLLLLLDDERGTLTSHQHVPTVLGGAVLIELALRGDVEIEEDPGRWRKARVHPAAGADPEDPVLADAVRLVAAKERSAQDLVGRLGKGLKERLTDRLVERGLLERRQDRVLGLFPRTRWPAADTRHEDEVRQRLTSVLVSGTTPDPRTGALVALLSAADRAHKVVDHQGRSTREIKARAKEVAEGAWAAKAVKDAIAAANAAVVAVMVAASAGGATSGG